MASLELDPALESSAASEFVALWESGACDVAAHSRLQGILSRTELSGRLCHGSATDAMFGRGLLTSDRWKRLSWIFGPDALPMFLGKDAREICVLLGFGEEWLNDKIPKGKKFKLAIFPSKAVDAQCATWEGVTYLLEKHFPEVWPKVSRHLPEIQNMGIDEIETMAGYDMCKTNLVGRRGGEWDTEGESDDPNYTSLQRLLNREGTLVQVRQFLWDEVGIKGLFSGDGRTVNDKGERGPNEYLAKNRRLEDIEGCVVVDAPVEKYLIPR